MAEMIGAIDRDGKGCKHWRVGHDVTPDQAMGWDGERGGMKRRESWRKGRGDYKDMCDLGSHNRGELLEGDRINCSTSSYSQRVVGISMQKIWADDRDEASVDWAPYRRSLLVPCRVRGPWSTLLERDGKKSATSRATLSP
jgi:hypothetical protein